MKVLIGDEWKEFEVELTQPHSDGGVVVESAKLDMTLSVSIGASVREMILIADEISYILIALFDCADWQDTDYYHAELSDSEMHTYATLV